MHHIRDSSIYHEYINTVHSYASIFLLQILLQVQHIDTFPGLAVVCDTPGVAYLSASDHWAAVGRWRSCETVEVFKHPKGQRRSVTRGAKDTQEF